MKQLLKTLLLSSVITVPTAFGSEPETLGSSEGAQLSTTIEHTSEQKAENDQIAQLVNLTDDQFNATRVSYIFKQIFNFKLNTTADRDTVIHLCKRACNHPQADNHYISLFTDIVLNLGDAYYPEALYVFRKLLEKKYESNFDMLQVTKRISSKGFIFDDTAVELYERAFKFDQEPSVLEKRPNVSERIPFLIRDIAKKYAEDSAVYNQYIGRALAILRKNLNFAGDDAKLKELLLKAYPDSNAPFIWGKFHKELDDILGK